jgi:gamma-glutamyltranspeptidase/glutathione hydrolase
MAISLTTTINLWFGSHVMVPETGIIMNDEMNGKPHLIHHLLQVPILTFIVDFSIPGSSDSFGYVPSPYNYIRPGKRPLSSITATIITDCDTDTLQYVLGAAGGSRILTSTIQNAIHFMDEGLSPREALARPRLHDQLLPNSVSFEYAYDNSTVAYMKSLGHDVTWVAPGDSTAQAIQLLANGTFEAAGEPRQSNSGGIAV